MPQGAMFHRPPGAREVAEKTSFKKEKDREREERKEKRLNREEKKRRQNDWSNTKSTSFSAIFTGAHPCLVMSLSAQAAPRLVRTRALIHMHAMGCVTPLFPVSLFPSIPKGRDQYNGHQAPHLLTTSRTPGEINKPVCCQS